MHLGPSGCFKAQAYTPNPKTLNPKPQTLNPKLAHGPLESLQEYHRNLCAEMRQFVGHYVAGLTWAV